MKVEFNRDGHFVNLELSVEEACKLIAQLSECVRLVASDTLPASATGGFDAEMQSGQRAVAGKFFALVRS